MKLLALNTAGKDTQIAFVLEEREIVKSAGFSRHSETLFPLLNELKEENNINFSDLDALACVIGPGSFTGIRIGMSVVKGFALALNKPIIAINSLELLAYNRIDSAKNPICAVINAGAGLVYHQTFVKNGARLEQVVAPRVDKFEHFVGYLKANYNGEVDIIYNHNGEKGTNFADSLGESEEYKLDSLVAISKYKFEAKEFTDAVNASPLYLRVSQAEQMIGDFELKRASLEDINDILTLESQGDEWDLSWNETAVRQSFDNPNYRCFLGRANGEVKALVAVMLVAGEAEILRVVVHRSVRLLGVATKMLNALIEELRVNCKTIFLEVNSLNFPAYSLYKKLGFSEVGRRADYYKKGEDAVLMRRDL